MNQQMYTGIDASASVAPVQSVRGTAAPSYPRGGRGQVSGPRGGRGFSGRGRGRGGYDTGKAFCAVTDCMLTGLTQVQLLPHGQLLHCLLVCRLVHGIKTSIKIETAMPQPSMAWIMVETEGIERRVENQRTVALIGQLSKCLTLLVLTEVLSSRKRRSSPGLEDTRSSKRR